MNLFILFCVGTYILGLRLAKEKMMWSYIAAAVLALYLTFAYFYLDQI